MIVPYFEVLVAFAEVLLHAPTVRERTDVHATAGSTYSTEHILMTDRIPHRTVSTHAQAGNGTLAAVRNGIQILVCICYQFLGNEGFITAFRYYRAVPIPTVAITVRANEDDAVSVGYFREIRTYIYPCLGMTTVSVK